MIDTQEKSSSHLPCDESPRFGDAHLLCAAQGHLYNLRV